MLALIRSYSTQHSAFMRRQLSADLSRQLASAQTELSTGMKEDVFKSLGTSAAETLNLRASLDRDEAQVAANGLLVNRMDTMAQTLGTIRDTVQGALELGVANKTGPLGTVSGMQAAAKAALQAVISQANSSHAGVPLFAGIEGTPRALQPWDQANSNTGKSPADVMDEILSGGLTSAADAQARVAELADAFADSSATAGWNFEETFYNGAATGAPRAQAAIGNGTVVDYSVQANDEGFRKVIQGLAMLASADPAQIDDIETYKVWVGAAVDALSSGNAALLQAETRIGAQAATVENANEYMVDRMDLYKSRVLDLEGIDSYEAATRISLLETQLQASYAVTARLSQLSFLNYMR